MLMRYVTCLFTTEVWYRLDLEMYGLLIAGDFKDGISSMCLRNYTDNRDNGIENLTCMAFSGTGSSEVVAAGGQNNVLLLNIDRGSVIKQVR
jgi:hypothetical protein